MPRPRRVAVGEIVYHVLNRANARMDIFSQPWECAAFRQVLAEAHEPVPMRTIRCCLMPNHWHLLGWPRKDGDLSAFMRWPTMTRTQRRHAAPGSAGSGRVCVNRGRPYGREDWVGRMVRRGGPASALRPRGRPRKHPHAKAKPQ